MISTSQAREHTTLAHLYNLATDPQERSECSLEYPGVVAELRQRLQKYVEAATKPIDMFSNERAVDPASDPGLGDGVWGPWSVVVGFADLDTPAGAT